MKQFVVLVVIASSVFHAAAVKPPAPKAFVEIVAQELFEFEYYWRLKPQEYIQDASQVVFTPGISWRAMKRIQNDLIGILDVQRDTLSSEYKLKIIGLVDAFNKRLELEKHKIK